MIAVLFELRPADAAAQRRYFDLAAELQTHLAEIEGFISIERFASLSESGKFLSISFWRDEAAIARWRKVEAHRAAQAAGRAEILATYRLRVANVVRDYGKEERDGAPADSRKAHDGR